MRIAVVTPYFDEADDVLGQCHNSVACQTHPVTHILVSDGKPSPLAATFDARHIVLERSHRDGGNTPRAVGAICALNEGFDAVAFLDGDNWFAPRHIESCVATCQQNGVPVALAQRRIVLTTGTECPFDDLDSHLGLHVDTSCFFLTKEVAFLWALWGQIPPAIGRACDRLMMAAIRAKGIAHASTGERTVYYRSHWGMHFRAMGLPAPKDEHTMSWSMIRDCYDEDEIRNRFGFDPEFDLSICSNKFRADPADPEDFRQRLYFFDSSIGGRG